MDSDKERLIAGRTNHSPAVYGGRTGGKFHAKGETGMYEGLSNNEKEKYSAKRKDWRRIRRPRMGSCSIRFGIAITVT